LTDPGAVVAPWADIRPEDTSNDPDDSSSDAGRAAGTAGAR